MKTVATIENGIVVNLSIWEVVPQGDPSLVDVTGTVVGIGWTYAGGVFAAPTAAAPAVPQSVSRFQARAALYQAGHLQAVETLMADAATPTLTRLAWQDAQEFIRTSPTVQTMGQAVDLTTADIDALFIAAAQISA